MPAYPSAVKGHFHNEIQLFRGYWMVRWCIRPFGSIEVERASQAGVSPEAILYELRRDSVPRADGLVWQPFWDSVLGETGPEVRGSIVGLNSSHTRADLYRALPERGWLSLCALGSSVLGAEQIPQLPVCEFLGEAHIAIGF